MKEVLEAILSEQLAGVNTILLAGAGGGFDIFAGLPLYFALRRLGKTVYLANLSFSTIYASSGKRIGPSLVEVDAKTTFQTRYFPEVFLARWFVEYLNENISIFCIDRMGAAPIAHAYEVLVERLNPDALMLVDGGTDSLMRGDEISLGTPQEDAASLVAADSVDVSVKLLFSVGFGIDTHHGICHAYFLEAVAELSRSSDFLGSWSLLRNSPEAAHYKSAVEYLSAKLFNHPSIVNTSIVAAIDGHFGDFHSTSRTDGSELFINPLMSMYWAFNLTAVAKRNLYLDQIRNTETFDDLSLEIEQFRETIAEYRPWKALPF